MTDAHFRFTQLVAFLVAVTALTAFAGAVASPTAAASKSCAKQVVADWYGDGGVDSIYPLHCYQDAIRSLPIDVLDYSNAKEDILRALAFARKGKPDPGPTGSPRPAGEDDPSTTTGPGGGPGDPNDPGDPSDTVASPPVDTSGPSSVPIPLLVLGGLAVLLLAAGGAGYLSRRAQARREGGPPGPG